MPEIAYAWERAIPFLPWTIIPYWLLNFFYARFRALAAHHPHPHRRPLLLGKTAVRATRAGAGLLRPRLRQERRRCITWLLRASNKLLPFHLLLSACGGWRRCRKAG